MLLNYEVFCCHRSKLESMQFTQHLPNASRKGLTIVLIPYELPFGIHKQLSYRREAARR